MIKAGIFDLDGTLAYTLDSMAYIANEVMKKLGLRPLPLDNFRYYCGEGADMLVRRALKDAGDPELVHYEEARKMYRERFDEDPLYKVTRYDGMQSTVEELRKKGMKLAVCSNKPHPAALKVMDYLYPGIFDLVIGQQEGIRRKPAPDAPLLAAKKLGV